MKTPRSYIGDFAKGMFQRWTGLKPKSGHEHQNQYIRTLRKWLKNSTPDISTLQTENSDSWTM